jgi:hypothetical protein
MKVEKEEVGFDELMNRLKIGSVMVMEEDVELLRQLAKSR